MIFSCQPPFNVPPDMDSGSWYDGLIYVGLKGFVFQPPSSLRHATEMYRTILTKIANKPFTQMLGQIIEPCSSQHSQHDCSVFQPEPGLPVRS